MLPIACPKKPHNIPAIEYQKPDLLLFVLHTLLSRFGSRVEWQVPKVAKQKCVREPMKLQVLPQFLNVKAFRFTQMWHLVTAQVLICIFSHHQYQLMLLCWFGIISSLEEDEYDYPPGCRSVQLGPDGDAVQQSAAVSSLGWPPAC